MKGISDMSNKISVKLILELKAQGLSQNEIARTRHMSKSSVSDVIRIAGEKGLSFEDVEGMNNDALYQMFFPDRITSEHIYEFPDYEYVHNLFSRIMTIADKNN